MLFLELPQPEKVIPSIGSGKGRQKSPYDNYNNVFEVPLVIIFLQAQQFFLVF